MTKVFSTVLQGEILSPQTPAQAAQEWINNLLRQLRLDGFGFESPSPNDGEAKLDLTFHC